MNRDHFVIACNSHYLQPINQTAGTRTAATAKQTVDPLYTTISKQNIYMGKLAEVKTKPNNSSVEDFINSVAGEQKRKDCLALIQLMQQATGEEPKMWGSSIVGFGYVVVKSPTSGREVEWFRVGFSPRKANLSIYLNGNMEAHSASLARLGKHKTGMGCLYVNKLDDIDQSILEEIINTTAGSTL